MLLLSSGTLEHGVIEAGCASPPTVAVGHDRQAHNLKVIGSNPIPATISKARWLNELAGFFRANLRNLPRMVAIPPSANEINAFLSRIIAYWRVHVTRSAHGGRVSVRQAFQR